MVVAVDQSFYKNSKAQLVVLPNNPNINAEIFDACPILYISWVMFKIGMIDQIMMRYLIVVVLWQMSQEHKIILLIFLILLSSDWSVAEQKR